jgi:hypothetical protein
MSRPSSSLAECYDYEVAAGLHLDPPSPCDRQKPTYLNYAVWESTADFRAAFTRPDFRAQLSAYPSSAVPYPHLFQKLAVPGIGVDH